MSFTHGAQNWQVLNKSLVTKVQTQAMNGFPFQWLSIFISINPYPLYHLTTYSSRVSGRNKRDMGVHQGRMNISAGVCLHGRCWCGIWNEGPIHIFDTSSSYCALGPARERRQNRGLVRKEPQPRRDDGHIS